MIDKTRTFKRWTPGKSGGGKLSETKGECGVSLLTRQSETRSEAYGRGSVGERGALWEQVAVSVRAARAVYRAPLSLSIFRGGKDYLVTDGPFAYPLDLWCIHARGCEPTQRSIDATRVSLSSFIHERLFTLSPLICPHFYALLCRSTNSRTHQAFLFPFLRLYFIRMTRYLSRPDLSDHGSD